jgi:hypothetical protein
MKQEESPYVGQLEPFFESENNISPNIQTMVCCVVEKSQTREKYDISKAEGGRSTYIKKATPVNKTEIQA